VSKLAQYASDPTRTHWHAVLRIFAYIRGTLDFGIRLGSSDNPLTGWFDASYADDVVDRHSTCGYIFLYKGGPVSWRSKKQSMVALSSTEAEYVAATEAAKELQWLISFLKGIMMGSECVFPMQMWGDNNGANSLTENPTYHSRTKHIDVRYRYVTELVEREILKVNYCNTKDMIADIFTKPLQKDQFRKLRTMIGCTSLKSNGESANVATTKRGGTSTGPFECDVCKSQFGTRNDLFKHLTKSGHFENPIAGDATFATE